MARRQYLLVDLMRTVERLHDLVNPIAFKLKLKPRLSGISSVITIIRTTALEPSPSRTGQGGSRLLPDSWKLVK
jgi:hypothetical protein